MRLIGHCYTVQRGRRWLAIVGGLILVELLLGVLLVAGVVGPSVYVGFFVVIVGVNVVAVLDFVLPVLSDASALEAEKQEPPQPVREVAEGSVWRDKTACEELVKVIQVLPGGLLVIERIAGAFPATLRKPWKVLEAELRERFEEVTT